MADTYFAWVLVAIIGRVPVLLMVASMIFTIIRLIKHPEEERIDRWFQGSDNQGFWDQR